MTGHPIHKVQTVKQHFMLSKKHSPYHLKVRDRWNKVIICEGKKKKGSENFQLDCEEPHAPWSVVWIFLQDIVKLARNLEVYSVHLDRRCKKELVSKVI